MGRHETTMGTAWVRRGLVGLRAQVVVGDMGSRIQLPLFSKSSQAATAPMFENPSRGRGLHPTIGWTLSSRMPILALFILLFVVFAGWIGKWKKDPFKTGGGTGRAAFAASGVGAPASTGYFTVGSTRKEVRAAQGMPTWVQGDTWHYGSSRVEYRKGRVKGWASSPDHPLRARLSPSDGPATAIGGIRIGSTKDEILRLHGTPTRLDDDVWEYG